MTGSSFHMGLVLLAAAVSLAALPPEEMSDPPLHASSPASATASAAPEVPLPPLSPTPSGDGVPPPPSPYLSVKFRDDGYGLALPRLQQHSSVSVVRHNPFTGVHTLAVPGGADPEDVALLFAGDPLVEWAEVTKWRRLNDGPTRPDDPHFALYQQWYYDLVDAASAWGMETGKPSVIIAVLDSGVLCSHPDLAGNIWRNPGEVPGDGVDNDKNGYVDDLNGYDFVGTETGNPDSPPTPGRSDPCIGVGDPSVGNGLDDDRDGAADAGVIHGTLVAGVAAAATNNSLGVAGACWRCTVMAVRVANPEGWVRSSDVADGVTYAAKNGAKVINLSLGGNQISLAERAAIDLAVTTFGVVVVAAAGNQNRHPIAYPAQLPNVIAVGSSGRTNPKGRAPFSNWGTGGSGDRAVDLVAPGVDLASTAVVSAAEALAGLAPAGSASYYRASGTSFSAPMVSGLVGLMRARNPSLTPAEIKSVLKRTANALPDDPTDLPDAGPAWAGAGMVNAGAALNAVPQLLGTPTATPTAAAIATATPGAGNERPQLLSPAPGEILSGMGTTLSWRNSPGATQYQIQVVPANDDGPGINLIRNITTSYTVEPPLFSTGPYVMLPDMTYTWRVRTTTATVPIDETSLVWSPWSAPATFRTRTAASAGISPVAPLPGATAVGRMPVLQWTNGDREVFYYEVQLSKDPGFSSAAGAPMLYWELRHGGITAPPNSYAVPPAFPLEEGTTYHWRVRPRVQGNGNPVPWSPPFSFSTQ